MKNNRARIIAWGLAGLVITFSGIKAISWITNLAESPMFNNAMDVLGWALIVPIVFAMLSALIIARQPGNRVGWLMMIIALSVGISNFIDYLLTPYTIAPPAHLTAGLWLMLFLRGSSWVPSIFPIFLIPLYFPTGHPPTPRWHWVTRLALGMMLAFYVLASLTTIFETPNWSIPNPIGVIPASFWESGFMLIWTAGLVAVVAGSVASLYVRYRRTGSSERQQIKVLLLAGTLFLIIYAFMAFTASESENGTLSGWVSIVFLFAILGIPAAIAVAIFRYRLWDLDVVINRALIYGPLTTLMAGTFAMVIALTSELTKEALGDQSKALGAAISAVIVAVVFQPLRSRIEAFVDKHFYPQKLDLASGLVEVMPEYWSFLNREKLMRLAMGHVRDVLGTEHAAFYLASGTDRFSLAGQLNGAGDYPLITLSKRQHDELHKKHVVESEGMAPLAGHVPLFIDRGKSNEVLGLLSVGSRTNGKGYSGDDLKGLAELGNKIGLALNAIKLAEEEDQAETAWRVGTAEAAAG
jgi:hypothetical protein